MLRRLTLMILAAFATGCGKSAERDTSDQSADQASAAPEASAEIDPYRKLVDRNAQHPELSPTQKIGGWEGRSPFEGDRVVGLNEIVKRSLDVSREYDRNVAGIRLAVDKAVAAGAAPEDRRAAEDGLKTVEAWYDRAKAAYDDMAKAEADLRASGEVFNEGIFDAMKKFVTDIEGELRAEKAAIAEKLGQA